MARYFEKVSYEEFKRNVFDDREIYNSYELPERKTKYAAGYDIKTLSSYTIKPKETLVIPTGIKVCMNEDEVLLLIIRSSMGFKHNIRLVNQVGIIDYDYYNNTDNEGHIFIKIENHGDKDFVLNKNDRVVQGIFTKYLVVDNEKKIKNKRIGGIGSTKEGN